MTETKRENEDKKKDLILINTIYTGDYTEKNIGHEIINLYKTDEGENYIYISPHGDDVADKKRDAIKEVLFARSAGKEKSEIIGKAIGLKYWGKDEKIDNIEQFAKDTGLEINLSDIKFKEYLSKKNKEKIQEEIKKEADKKIKLDLRKNPTTLDSNEEDYNNKKELLEKYYQRIKNEVIMEEINPTNTYFYVEEFIKFKGEDVRKHLHNLQVRYIKQNNICYDGILLDKCFVKNAKDNQSIYLTYKVKSIVKPQKPFIIDYGKDEIKDILKGNSESKDDNEKIKLRNQKCIYYITSEQLRKIENLYREKWEDTEKLENSKIKAYKETFLDIIGKSYDELVFSNLIAYFFEKDKELLGKFCEYCITHFKEINNETKNKLKEVEINKTYEISREVVVENGRIDILIKTDNSLFVIENKVKSGINGEKYNYNTEEYSNQLINYYNHFQDNEVKEKELKGIKHQYYFIFAPNHNNIDKKQIEEKCTTEDNKKIIEKYSIVKYSELKEFFKKNEPKNLSKEQKFYFEEFIKSLKNHSNENDNEIERLMEYKFRSAIGSAKNRGF
jgi:hypothetical protein